MAEPSKKNKMTDLKLKKSRFLRTFTGIGLNAMSRTLMSKL
jgi:hypothetical protein